MLSVKTWSGDKANVFLAEVYSMITIRKLLLDWNQNEKEVLEVNVKSYGEK